MNRIDFIDTNRSLMTQEDACILGQATNCLICKRAADLTEAELDDLWKYGLDIRLFCSAGEIKWFRASIQEPFRKRERLQDAALEKGIDYFDEDQYLDIDTTRSGAGVVYATGGGRYTLPLRNLKDAKVRIRNYLEYEAVSGCAYVCDWRIVELLEGRD